MNAIDSLRETIAVQRVVCREAYTVDTVDKAFLRLQVLNKRLEKLVAGDKVQHSPDCIKPVISTGRGGNSRRRHNST